jgi:hypothetical protein
MGSSLRIFAESIIRAAILSFIAVIALPLDAYSSLVVWPI